MMYFNREDLDFHRGRPAIDLVFSITTVYGVQTYGDPQIPSAELVIRLFHIPFFPPHPARAKNKNYSTVNSILMLFWPNPGKIRFFIRGWLQLPYSYDHFLQKTNSMSSSSLTFSLYEMNGMKWLWPVNKCSYCALGPMQYILILVQI